MIAEYTTTMNTCNMTGACNTCTLTCNSNYDNVYYVYNTDPYDYSSFDDIKEQARLLNLEACRWILKYVWDWIMPIDPILKRARKNNRMMFFKRSMGIHTLLEILIFILLWR